MPGITDFTELKQRMTKRVEAFKQRDIMYDAIQRIYTMTWELSSTQDWVKTTLSPDGAVAINGMVRLLSATEPTINVPAYADKSEGCDIAARLEKGLRAVWTQANRGRRWPIHYDVAFSGSLFSEIALQVGNTEDVLERAEMSGRNTKYLKRKMGRIPYLFHVHHPRYVYPSYDALGLTDTLYRRMQQVGELKRLWPEEDIKKFNLPEDHKSVEVAEYWDDTHQLVWFPKHGDEPLYNEEHGLDFLPWVCVVCEGSSLFPQPEEQRNPILKPMWKGGWWNNQNLLLSEVYSLLRAMGNPTFVTETEQGAHKKISLAGGDTINLRIGEKVYMLEKNLLTPEMMAALQMADGKVIASTLPRIVFGESPDRVMSYAAMNMLGQGGRLPLQPVEKQGARAISEALEAVLFWIALKNEVLKIPMLGEMVEIRPDDIDIDIVEVDVKLKADIPQDRLQLANIVNTLSQARASDGRPLISRKTAHEFMEFASSEDEEKQIIKEAMVGLIFQEIVERMERAGDIPEGLEGMSPSADQLRQMVSGQEFNPAAGGLPSVMGGEVTEPEVMGY
jgi:hypothetical protein